MGPTDCVKVHGLTQGQLAAFQYHGRLTTHPLFASAQAPESAAPQCQWLIVDSDAIPSLETQAVLKDWTRVQIVRRPSDDNEDVVLWKRRTDSEVSPRP